MVPANQRDGFVGIRRAMRNCHVFGLGQGRVEAQHRAPRPLDQAGLHLANENQRRVFQVTDL